jgi:hypothetical protein
MSDEWSMRKWRKDMIKKYPYLMPRNSFTGEVSKDYDYTFLVGEYDLPKGWFELFLQLCEDIREPLERCDQLDKFRFLQVKEKYGWLRCYNSGANEEVNDIIDKYEVLSTQVCSMCGQPAKYMTNGYICPYCSNCVEKSGELISSADSVDIQTSYVRTRYSDGQRTETIISVEDEWNRYLERIGTT